MLVLRRVPHATAHYARPAMRLHDTATGEIRELAQREPGTVSIYLCGPTVYGPPHIGHGRATVVYDILRRYLEWSGLAVRLVSNVTDIDDKIIERAQREGRDPADIAHRCEAVWWQAMDALDVARPTDDPHATAWVDDDGRPHRRPRRRRARPTSPTTASTSTSPRCPTTGCSLSQSLAELRAGGGDRPVVGAEHKRDPADFALWKLAKPGEPAWPSPWGDGRPGWHTECVVMSLAILGEGFDLHCGGLDLKFPHHENERAQAVALGKRFANHWMHHAFVVDAEGEKMSKSLGNFDNLLDLIDTSDPRAFRMALLQAHYRSPVQISRDTIDAAEKAVDRLDALARRADGVPAARRARRRLRSTPFAPPWTTTSTRRARWPTLFGEVDRGERCARRRRPRRAPRRTSAAVRPWPKRSAWSSTSTPTCPTTCRRRSPRSTRRGRRRTTPPPMPYGPS